MRAAPALAPVPHGRQQKTTLQSFLSRSCFHKTGLVFRS
jgi:hypothetical protein